jgi:MFS family permease
MAVEDSIEAGGAGRPSPWAEVRSVLGRRTFRLLWLGEGVSLIGDQFAFIALPWLVLQLTGDAFAMGAVLAVAGVPRALFMLFGGALTDRFSPRRVMLVTNLARMLFVGVLAAVILAGGIELWMIYLFALCFGLADAFFYPAASAIVPDILPREQLQIGNSITQGTAQLSVFLGPVLAGSVIALFGQEAAAGAPDLRGVGLAFAIDALTFLISALTLKLMGVVENTAVSPPAAAAQSVWEAMREGLAFVKDDEALRTIFLIVAALTVLGVAPINLGMPVLADERLPNGAASFGLIMSAYGAGSLIGILLSGLLPGPPPRIFGPLLLGMVALIGLLTMALAFAGTLPTAALLLALMGVLDGYTIIQFTTWLQLRTPEALIGRVMSLLMFAFVGLAPVADVLVGALLEWDLNAVLLGSGALLALVSLWAAAQPSVRGMGTAVGEGSHP